MKKILLTLIIFVQMGFVTISMSPTVNALTPETGTCEFQGKCEDGCTKIGQCIDNFKCIVIPGEDPRTSQSILKKSDKPNCNSSDIGGVDLPEGIKQFNDSSGGDDLGGESIGIIVFISNLLKVFAIICGIWAMFNFVVGGYTFITSMSDAGAYEKVRNSITMTIIGLAIIAAAYTIAGLIGLLMFGNAGFILNPQLDGAL